MEISSRDVGVIKTPQEVYCFSGGPESVLPVVPVLSYFMRFWRQEFFGEA